MSMQNWKIKNHFNITKNILNVLMELKVPGQKGNCEQEKLEVPHFLTSQNTALYRSKHGGSALTTSKQNTECALSYKHTDQQLIFHKGALELQQEKGSVLCNACLDSYMQNQLGSVSYTL